MDKKLDGINFTKQEEKLYNELLKLSKTTKVRPVKSFGSYQFINHKKDDE